jgi:predicted pyridoxine 5'-phosphate oxidase superfamily flavin-nucleotide-binding protein
MINDDMRRLIEEQRLGFIATVNADGSPNVSPKGTFMALDARTIGFAEMRSPQTLANIARDGRVEVNFVDPFARKGMRFRGAARFVMRGEAEFDRLCPKWQAIWGDELGALFNGFVLITVESTKPLTSPAYDLGADERALREEWLEKHGRIQRGHLDG